MRVLACDLFLDADTVDAAADVERAPGSLAGGLDREALPDALARLAARNGATGCPLVYASGLEDRPHLIAALALQFRIWGNGSGTITDVKDPAGFAAAMHMLGIPHPQTRLDPPPAPDGWLAKRPGASGGAHVHPLSAGRAAPRGAYYQRQVDGTPVSLLFAAQGAIVLPLGFSEQWAAPAPGMPFRYGGALQPARIGHKAMGKIADWASAAARHLGLQGLWSAAFIVDGDAMTMIEINPRPGATLDIFRHGPVNPLAAHIACFQGTALADFPGTGDAAATAIVYADRGIEILENTIWPQWVADRPSPGTEVAAGAPFCTVLARASTVESAMERLNRRMVKLRKFV